MSEYAVSTVWSFADQGVDVAARDREFRERIIPELQQLPGFVHGLWARTPDGSRSHNTLVFDDRGGADALVAHIERNKPHSAAAGVHLESLEILDVVVSS
jgi:hypothetical protein